MTEYLSAVNPVVWSFTTFLLGVLLGHRVALHRDKRKEYNEIVDLLRRDILRSWEFSPSLLDMDRLKALMTIWNHWRLRRAIHAHQQLLADGMKQDEYGSISYTNQVEIVLASKTMLRLLPRR